MNSKTILLASIYSVLFIITACHGQHDQKNHGYGHGHGMRHGHEKHATNSKQNASESKEAIVAVENFPAVAFKKVHEKIIPFPVKKVFPLFEPQGRHLLYKNWDPVVLRKGENGSLKGQVEFSKYDELDVMLTVREYNPQEGHIQYFVVWDDFEIQRIDIYCKPGEKENTTKMTWIEHNAGLYEKGEYLVSMFVKDGHLDKVVERYVNNVKSKLQAESN